MTCASDIWSFGVTMLQLLQSDVSAPYGSGATPLNIVMQLVVQKEPPRVPPTPEVPDLQPLLQSCLALEPAARPTAQQVVQVRNTCRGPVCRASMSLDWGCLCWL
mgnify:CR=1 FL=1